MSVEKKEKTEVGSVFISNYPPFSSWQNDSIPQLQDHFRGPASAQTPMGLYMHIPFCRKRCKFCYFKVYTDKNSREVQNYLDAVEKEATMLGQQQAVRDRDLGFVYVGGGTPSYIGGKHLQYLMKILRDNLSWNNVEEVTFECEPGTLTRSKLESIKAVGVTRLSLGVENFDDTILSENGRAHISTEIYRVLPWIREMEFDQFNIDLIAGMVGETWENWKENIRKTIDIAPDSVTIYQMELPFNTVYSKGVLQGSSGMQFADWQTKRAWHDYAINTLSENGYAISSAYTMVRRDKQVHFRYRDSLWHGADLLALGVSSFGHLNGIHYQNEPSLERYNGMVESGEMPVKRAFSTTPRNRLIREMILQLKLGHINAGYFRDKFDEDILALFDEAWREYTDQGMLSISGDEITLTRDGLLRVDALLPGFYEPSYRNARYT